MVYGPYDGSDIPDMKAWQEDANNGQIIIGVYNSATTGGGGHIILLVPGKAKEAKGDWKPLKNLPVKLECGSKVEKASGVLLKLNMSFNKTFKEMIWYKYIGSKKQ